MNIGFFTHSDIAVSETFIYDLLKGLDKKSKLIWFSGKLTFRHQIIQDQIALNYSPYENKLPYWAFKIGQLKGNFGYRFRMMTYQSHAKRALKKIVKSELPDIAYVEFLTTAILLREFFEQHDIPYVVHVHGYDISSELIDPEYKIELSKVFKSVNMVIAASHYIKRLLILEGCPPEKISVIRLGIDTDQIVPLSWEDRLQNDPSVIFLGRLTEKKNPIALIYTFDIVRKKIPNAKLTIIGDGPLRTILEDRIKLLGLENHVSLLGALPREKGYKVMNQHWIYAQHSVTAITGDKEGYAISPAEAAAHELPVVSTLHNGIPEHVLDGITGYLVPEFDYESMAERIIELIENPHLAEKMGKFGRKNIIALNNPQKRIDSIYDLLAEVYKNKNADD